MLKKGAKSMIARNKLCPDCGKPILTNSLRCRSCATRKQFLGKKKKNTQNMKGPKSLEHAKAISAALSGKKKSPQHLSNLRRSLMAKGQWKQIGETYIHKGYRCIKTREGNGNNNFILEHRVIMEKFLGRPLKRTEIVHHKNGTRDDNRLENLEILTNIFHAHIHKPSEDTKKKMSDKRKAYWNRKHQEITSKSGLEKMYPAHLRQT